MFYATVSGGRGKLAADEPKRAEQGLRRIPNGKNEDRLRMLGRPIGGSAFVLAVRKARQHEIEMHPKLGFFDAIAHPERTTLRIIETDPEHGRHEHSKHLGVAGKRYDASRGPACF